jgi:DNA-binding CsgD family transcriptional regulator
VGVDRHEKLPGSVLQLTRLQADLQLLAVHTHVAARRLLQKPAPKALAALQLPHLSPREVDVLRWTDNGKTVIEIAMILGVGERTVKSYLDLAKEKLGVVGKKEQAVKVAKALGLI